uniref:Retrotransposon gag domain-containing protein n=1 Tax=Nicotiana tabacum TaxID=4097 RepID=A0A1S3XER1_TOBAC|nr:PREDICTED: uncharacterized protein LOC107764433 [Nicotiana tabacum]
MSWETIFPPTIFPPSVSPGNVVGILKFHTDFPPILPWKKTSFLVVSESFISVTNSSWYIGELVEQWEKCNAIVLSWTGITVSNQLMPGIVYASDARKVWNDFQERFDRSNLTRIYYLWPEIATMRQGTDSVTSYYTKMKDLMNELDVLAPISCCDCEESRTSVEHVKYQRMLQFLMGLNENYRNVRSNILARRLVVTINEAYAIVSQDESQRTLGVVISQILRVRRKLDNLLELQANRVAEYNLVEDSNHMPIMQLLKLTCKDISSLRKNTHS